MAIRLQRWSELSDDARAKVLRRPALDNGEELAAGVARIISTVRERGDAALRDFTAQYDGAELADFLVDASEFDTARAMLDPAAVEAIDVAIANVRRFHEAQLPAELNVETMPGVACRRVSHAIDSVGLYVPAGSAPLPSAAIMLAVPAAVAGCPKRILCTPPRKDGSADPAVLVAAQQAGVSEIYKIGGAQAVAAMAYGTESVPKVLKIFGPGNAWVTAAKAQVAANPDGAAIDMPAGPSEVLVIADANASPVFVASDLLSQAEHGVDSQVILVTTCESLARKVQQQIERQLEALSRARIARESLSHSRMIVVDSLQEAVAVSNRYAPEHLILQVDDTDSVLQDVRNAGSVFVGPWTPEAVGDYCSGTNHVLPTYGFARTYSGLGVDQFVRQMTVQELTRDGLAALGTTVVTLAGLEGLDAHAAAVTCRLEAKP